MTPLYLLLEALDNIDAAFATYAKANPSDKGRQALWRSARSQLVDQFLGANGMLQSSQFNDPSLPAITPVLIGALRAQIMANCPTSFGAQPQVCTWARSQLAKNMETVMRGPTFAATMQLIDALRANEGARTGAEALLSYLLDAASQNDALEAMLASSDDMMQVLRDDENLVPFYHVLAPAMAASLVDPTGKIVQKGVVDAQIALFTRIGAKAFGPGGKEDCSQEIDPDGVLNLVIEHLVTPMKNPDGSVGETPLEVIIDVIADVNRASPDRTDKLVAVDYASISDNVVDFLMNKERGLEQFYAIVRNGTE